MSEKIHITIDGQKVETLAGQNLLQVARDHGFNIPGLCYHKKLSPTGACRLCLVKIEGISGMQASCGVNTQADMQVTAFDDELKEARTNILDALLAEHNEDDDGTYEDELKSLVKTYDLENPKNRHYPDLTQQLSFRLDASSPVLTYDASKCIKCFRCIKACDELQGKNILSLAQRGIESHIVAGFDHWGDSECDGCGECVQLCPTGALVEKPHRNEIHLDTIDKKVRTTCPYCGVGCQIELLIKDNRILRVNGVEGVMPNDGRLCIKGRFGYDFVSSKERLTKPLIKENGKFIEAEWDEAIALIAKRFNSIRDTHGRESLAGFASSKCTNEDNYIFQKFVRIALGNNNMDNCARLCHASTVTAMLKAVGNGAGSNSIEEFEQADCLFVTGNNIIDTHPITATYVKAGARKGHDIIVVDPKWTPLVNYATLWLQPALGSDVALLNGIMRQIILDNNHNTAFIRQRVEGGIEAFEALKRLVMDYSPEKTEALTGVASEKIIKAARIYSKAATAIIITGMGMSQQTTGTHNVFSLINMMLITGQVGRKYCGISPPRGQNNVQGTSDVGVSPTAYPGYLSVETEENRKMVAAEWQIPVEELNPNPGLTSLEIMNAAHQGTIKGVFIMGENPMVTDPDLHHTAKALKNLDFLVVQDIFHTETTPYADVILPAASFAETDGTFVSSDRRIQRVRKAIESPGEAREDWKIIQSIAKAMGRPVGEMNTATEVFDELTRIAPILRGVNYNRLEKQELQWPCPESNHPGTPTLFLDKFNTKSGKGILFPVEHIGPSERADKQYPFILNTGRLLFQYHSATMSRKSESLNAYGNESFLLINPLDAEKHQLSEGDRVKVSSRRGELKTQIKISTEVNTGELYMPWHFSESLVNNLTRAEMDPYSKIAPFKVSACKVEKV
ncbi:MAG: formate dehydrogenase subunit alpha [Bacteroidota bacterium]